MQFYWYRKDERGKMCVYSKLEEVEEVKPNVLMEEPAELLTSIS